LLTVAFCSFAEINIDDIRKQLDCYKFWLCFEVLCSADFPKHHNSIQNWAEQRSKTPHNLNDCSRCALELSRDKNKHIRCSGNLKVCKGRSCCKLLMRHAKILIKKHKLAKQEKTYGYM